MGNNASNVVVGKPLATGGILVAPLGTPLPVDDTEPLDAAFQPVGYVADAGLEKDEKREADTIKAWGGDTIAAIQKSYGVEWKFGLAEYLSVVAQRALYGDANVIATPATASVGAKLHVIGTSTPAPHKSWVFEMFHDVQRIRIVVPDAQITDIGDVSFKDAEIAQNPVTLTSFPGPDGAYFHEYADDGKPVV